MEFKHFRRLLEFFIIGVVLGITEDIIVVVISTDASFSWRVLGIVTLVAIPFAIISELIVDKAEFRKTAWWWDKNKK